MHLECWRAGAPWASVGSNNCTSNIGAYRQFSAQSAARLTVHFRERGVGPERRVLRPRVNQLVKAIRDGDDPRAQAVQPASISNSA
jgi:hypothetical protein